MRFLWPALIVAALGCNRPQISSNSSETADAKDPGVRVRTFTDPRDSVMYPTIGDSGKLWLANELYFKTPNSRCYNDAKECGEFGRMYSFDEAKLACPTGWHLPSEEEWRGLIDAVGGYYDLRTGTAIGDPRASYTALTVGSFNAKLTGSRSPEGKYIDQGGDGMYWTSSSCGGADSVALIVFNEKSGRVMRDCDAATGWMQSVRCVHDVREGNFK